MRVETNGAGQDDLEITIPEFLRDWQARGIQLIDVREPDEWGAGRMAGATLIPLGELEVRTGELDPGTPTVLVCRSGRRSLVAAEYLKAVGFSRPVSLAGGMLAWDKSGQPVER